MVMKKIITFICLLFFTGTVFANQKLIVLLDWFANPDHAPLFVAEQQGYFKQAGLDVVLLGPADPADPPKLVAAGKADIAITYQPEFIEQIDQGLPLIQIGTLIDKPLSCLVVLQSSAIHTIQDLKGKRIGYSGAGVASVILKTMLEKNAVSLNETEQINVHYDLTQALLAKKVDAVTGMMRTYEIIQLNLIHQPARIFLPEKNGVPAYNELIFVTHKKTSHDPRVAKFLIAVQQGVIYLKQHPEESWTQFAKLHPELNDSLNHQAWQATLPYFAVHPAASNLKQWIEFAEFMKKNGLIKRVRPINEYVVTT
jgi:putative hydroxymethylpyrimidine transport system substrate-binding protein